MNVVGVPVSHGPGRSKPTVRRGAAPLVLAFVDIGARPQGGPPPSCPPSPPNRAAIWLGTTLPDWPPIVLATPQGAHWQLPRLALFLVSLIRLARSGLKRSTRNSHSIRRVALCPRRNNISRSRRLSMLRRRRFSSQIQRPIRASIWACSTNCPFDLRKRPRSGLCCKQSRNVLSQPFRVRCEVRS